MNELSIFNKLSEIAELPQPFDDNTSILSKKIAQHKSWLKKLDREQPDLNTKYKIGIYIRYYNQTKYEDYLAYHKMQFRDTVSRCPNWTLVDFYIDEGGVAPNMESSPAWTRLLNDCFDGKVDLIITQKVSNVSRRHNEVALCSRILAAHEPPIGIYFISEDIFTLGSYYQDDLRDPFFLPSPDWQILPDTEEEERGLLHD